MLFGGGNSNDAKIRLLERRLRGDTPSPRNLYRAGSFGGQASQVVLHLYYLSWTSFFCIITLITTRLRRLSRFLGA